MNETNTPIILYTSNFCAHSWIVERFVKDHEIPVELKNINEDRQARQELLQINNGYASVPTLVFPDGTHLTEPSLRALRTKLGIETPGLVDKVRDLFIGDDE
jgi:mycoredoxin